VRKERLRTREGAKIAKKRRIKDPRKQTRGPRNACNVSESKIESGQKIALAKWCGKEIRPKSDTNTIR